MKSKSTHPPKLFHRFFRWYCHPQMLNHIEGDLLEDYGNRRTSKGKWKADLRFIWDVLLLLRPEIIRPMEGYQHLNNYGMYKSYLKMGWRSLLKNKLYSALNITGLTFGIVCFLLIGLYVYDELTFDNQHSNGDRIYRVITHESNPNNGLTVVAAAGYMLAEESPKTFPEVEMTTRLQRSGRANLVDPENPVYIHETVTVADEFFLQIFDFPLIEGDKRTALKEPNSIVITESLARRIFNRVDVVNKNLQFGFMQNPLKITGVLKDHPSNSTFNFTSVMSESTQYSNENFMQDVQQDWASTSFTVYALLKPQVNTDSVAGRMTQLVLANAADLEPGTTLSYSLQPLKDVHLHSEGISDGARNSNVDGIPQGNPLYITIFSFTAIFVLLIAGINYTNLTTARASNRIKEIGVRKTIGAVRGNLIRQFLVESLITTVIAFLLAVILVNLLLPPFNVFVNKHLSLFTDAALHFWLMAIAGIVVIGILSGGYVAVLLSRFNPVVLLKGLKLGNTGDLSVRKILVVFQFTLSTIMIIGTIVLFMQVRFLNNTDLGFNKELMLVIDVNVPKARSNFEWVKSEMTKVPAVQHVSVTSRVPGEWKSIRRVKLKKEGSEGEHQIAYALGADEDFLATYGIALLKGRNFQYKGDSSAILINETAAKLLGITEAEQPVDIPLIARNNFFTPIFDEVNDSFRPRVVGIVKDFNFQSLREKIQPLVIAYTNNPIQVIDYYSLRIAPQNIQGTLDKLKAIMVANDETEPFEYHFLDDQLALFYIQDERNQTILAWVAMASVCIACLGLFGLATYAAEQRLKEIGVRKVLGANVTGLFALLSKDFVKLVFVACCFAFPLAWWGTSRWLDQYAFHIEITWWIFALAGVITTSIALLTVSYQAIKTALVSPVKILKSE